MKYELLNKALCIKVDTREIDKINLSKVSYVAKKRINFLYELKHQIKYALRNGNIINMDRLVDAYSMDDIKRHDPKTIRRLLTILLTKENITYSEFIFTEKIGNQNRKLKNVNKEELLLKSIEI